MSSLDKYGSKFLGLLLLFGSSHNASSEETDWLEPESIRSIVSFSKSEGSPEEQGWKRNSGGAHPGSVDAHFEKADGLLLDDSSTADDFLTFSHDVATNNHQTLAKQGWILELDLTINGSEVILDTPEESFLTCAVQLLGPENEILHQVLLHLDPDTDGVPSKHSWQVNGIQHILKDGDTIRLEYNPNTKRIQLRLGGKVRSNSRIFDEAPLPHQIVWGSFPSSGTSHTVWRRVEFSEGDWTAVTNAEDEVAAPLSQPRLDELTKLSFSEPFPTRQLGYPPYDQLKYAHLKSSEVSIALSEPHLSISDDRDVQLNFLIGASEEFAKNFGTLFLDYAPNGTLLTINLLADSPDREDQSKRIVWSRDKRHLSQIDHQDSESNQEHITRALLEYEKRAESSPEPEINLALIQALRQVLPLYESEMSQVYFLKK